MAAAYAVIADLPGEFSGTDSDTAQFWLDVAQDQVDVSVFGDVTSRAHVLLASHLLKAAGEGTGATGGGAVSSRTVGSVSESYAVAAATSELESTTYGRAYLRLVKIYAGGPRAIRSNAGITVRR